MFWTSLTTFGKHIHIFEHKNTCRFCAEVPQGEQRGVLAVSQCAQRAAEHATRAIQHSRSTITLTLAVACCECWESGWECLFSTFNSLSPDDLAKTVEIRGVPHSVPLAIERSLGHTCYHIGQIVLIARIHAGDRWTVLTIPRGASEEFNRDNWGSMGKPRS